MLDLRQLLALRAVATRGSVSRAAVDLEWSQPTVDYHLRRLEKLAGVPLVERTSLGTRLTEAGELMRERGQETLAAAERALQDVRDFAEIGHATVRFGLFPSAAACLLAGIVERTQALGLNIEVVLDEVGGLAEKLNKGEVDAALLYSVPGHAPVLREGMSLRALYREPLQLAMNAAHPLAGRESMDRAALLGMAGEPWIVGLAEGDPIEDAVQELFAQEGLKLDGPVRTDDFSVIFGLAAAGMGVAVVPTLLPPVMEQEVSRVRIAEPTLERTLQMAAPSARSHGAAALRQLTQAVHQALTAILGDEDQDRSRPSAPRPS